MELAEQRYQHWCAQKTLDPELRQELAAAGVPNTDGWQDGDRILLRVSD